MVVPKINSSHGSETRNIINRAIEVLNQQGKSIQDLVAEGQLTDEQYARLITVINGLVKSGEVDGFDLSPELRRKILERVKKGEININDFDEQTRRTFLEAQGIDVNYTLGERAVGNKHLAYNLEPIKIQGIKEEIESRNLIDFSRIERDGYYHADGHWVISENYASSQMIPVEVGTVFSKSFPSHTTFWNELGDYVSGESLGRTFEVPNNPEIYFMRVGLNVNSLPLQRWVVSKGTFTAGSDYFKSKFIIDGKIFDFLDENISKVTRKTLGKMDVDDIENLMILLKEFNVDKTNLINPDEIVSGGYYSASTGDFIEGASYSTGLITVKPGERFVKTGNSNVTYWDENDTFITGSNELNDFTVPENDRIKYMRSSMANNPDQWMIVRGSHLPSAFVPYENYRIPKLEQTSTTVGPNANSPLQITAAGHTQHTHPSILAVPGGWNGYKYWMAVTPYPYGSAFLENPCIICSNDLEEWVEPSETVNPLDAVPEAERGEWFNSDTELIYINGQLELWWRRRNNDPFSEEFYRRKSSDGVNWTEKELCFRRDTSSSELSPSIIYEDGKYKMWTFQAAGTMRYYESESGTDFVFIREIEVGNVDMWHGSVRRNKEGLYEVYYSHGARHRNYKISYAYSTDNITYSDPIEVMKSVPLRFDSELYRPTFIDVEGSRNDVRIMAYGTVSEDSEFNIAITKALTVEPTNFQGMN